MALRFVANGLKSRQSQWKKSQQSQFLKNIKIF